MIESVKVLGDKEAARMFDEIGKQGPFAFSLTLNELAQRTQARIRERLNTRFTVRRPEFVRNTIYRKPREDFAIKSRLQSGVRIHPERDFLAKFEDGGEKKGKNGGRIAIPVDVRRNKAEVITKANRPRQLIEKNKRVTIVNGSIIQKMGKAKQAVTRVLYVLRKSVRITPRLGMKDAAREVMATQFDAIASAAIDKALKTAK